MKKRKVDPATVVRAFFERNGRVIMSAHDIAHRTGLNIGEVNRALIVLHQEGEVRVDSEARLWTNIDQSQPAIAAG